MTSPSMNCVHSAGNPDQAEITVPESGVQLNGTTRHTGPRATELVVQTGFIVVDRHGEFLSWAEHAESAIRRSRELDGAHEVRRCSDGALIAFRPRAFKSVRT